MTIEEIQKLALKTAEDSPCAKRKVGAVIVKNDNVISTGYNNNRNAPCEDTDGNTQNTTVHAEIQAIQNAEIQALQNAEDFDLDGAIMYVTHQPCNNCAKAIKEQHMTYEVVKSFMKFDTGKLRYSLIPPSATKALAEVLTYGAKKYKPNNWQKVDDVERYMDALYRHMEAYRSGEKFDQESGLSHLAHAMTNIAFLIYFDTL